MRTNPTTTEYSVVLAGGGRRAAWGLGVLDALDLPPPAAYAGLGAGGAMAFGASLGRSDRAIECVGQASPNNS